MSISTDTEKIQHLLTRGVERVVGDLEKRLLSGEKLRVKLGADPTAPDLHLGHAVQLRKLREFQDLGHTVVFIIGDATAMVGDPSGKSKTRPVLTPVEIEENAKTYMAQAGKILNLSKTEVRYNSEWITPMGFPEILQLTSQFTVARMIEREDFATRLAEGTEVHMHELLYPMLQAYDSVMIRADVEIGGIDQTFNILAGRDLQRKRGEREQACLFFGPMLVGTDGVKKMSKSLGNYVGLTDSPSEMYGKTMSIPDAALWQWFTFTTEVSDAEIAEMRVACEKGEMNPRDAKMRLAREITTIYHSAEAAAEAEEGFKALFQKKETPDEIVGQAIEGGTRRLVDVLKEVGLAKSGTEGRQLIEQGGVKVGGEVVTDAGATIEVGAESILIQKGKRHFVNVKAK